MGCDVLCVVSEWRGCDVGDGEFKWCKCVGIIERADVRGENRGYVRRRGERVGGWI